jgi:ABC-type transporter Mla subunit MlaD
MLGALSIPPRLVLRALDDLHSIAGSLTPLVDSVRVLPRTEDELSANIAALRDDIRALNALLAPLIASLEPLLAELRDLDQTAEGLDASMERLQALLKKLPGI